MIAIKEIFVSSQFANLLDRYLNDQDLDINEIQDWDINEWDLHEFVTQMNMGGANTMHAYSNVNTVAAFNTTQPEDTLFGGVTVKKEYEDIFVWFINFVGLKGFQPMSKFNPNEYWEYQD